MTPSIVAMLNLETHNNPRGPEVCFANQMREKLYAYVQVDVEFDSKKTLTTFYVRNFSHDILLGLDFLHNSCALIRFQKQTTSIQAAECNMISSSQKNNEILIQSCDTIVIPGRTKQKVQIRSSEPLDGYALFEPNKHQMILFPNALVNFVDRVATIFAINPANTTNTIYKAQTVGKLASSKEKRSLKTNHPISWQKGGASPPNINPNLEGSQRQQIDELINRYSRLFADRLDFGQIQSVEHEINLKPEARPFTSAPYERSPGDRKLITAQVQEMLKVGVIRPSKSQFASPVFLVKKRNGEDRFVIDYRKINSMTLDDRYPLPRISTVLDTLSGSTFFSTLDLTSGYWQVPVKEEHKERTAFITCAGLFEFNVMPFGLKTAPATFQRLMDSVLGGLKWTEALVYLDDIIIYGKNWEEHTTNLEHVFKALLKGNLRCNGKKCELGFTEVKFLGHIISGDGIKPDPRNLEPIRNAKPPKTVKELQSFLGYCNFYRKHIPGFSVIAKDLYELLHKDKAFVWTQQCEESFRRLQNALCSAPVIAHFRDDCPTRVLTDASADGIGGILQQQQDGEWRVIACVSRSTNPAERRYTITELEGLAIVWSLESLRDYLHGREFTLVTDNHAMCHIAAAKDTKRLKHNRRFMRWLLRLAPYTFTVIHRKGQDHSDVDHLSRFPLPYNEDREPPELPIFLIESREWITQQQSDEWCNKLQPDHKVTGAPTCRIVLRNNMKCIEQKIPGQNTPQIRLCVPESLRHRILSEFHSSLESGGHFGVMRTEDKMKKRFYWPGMTEDIRDYIKSCHECQMRNRKKFKKTGSLQQVVAEHSMEIIASDVVGPLPKTKRGNAYIITVIDYFSKWGEAKATKRQTSSDIVDMLTEIFARFGTPKQMITDQGPSYMSSEFTNFLKTNGITHTPTTTYHPQGNGLCERFNATIVTATSKYTNQKPAEWDLYLRDAVSNYNKSKQANSENSPFYVMFGREPSFAGDHFLPNKKLHQQLNEGERHSLLNKIRKNEEQNRAAYKRYYDSNVHETKFNAGDLVLVTHPYNQKPHKLQQQYTGPFEVVRRLGSVNYEIKHNDCTFTIHVDRLSKYYPPRTSTYPLRNAGTGTSGGTQQDEVEYRFADSDSDDDYLCEEMKQSIPAEETLRKRITREAAQIGKEFQKTVPSSEENCHDGWNPPPSWPRRLPKSTSVEVKENDAQTRENENTRKEQEEIRREGVLHDTEKNRSQAWNEPSGLPQHLPLLEETVDENRTRDTLDDLEWDHFGQHEENVEFDFDRSASRYVATPVRDSARSTFSTPVAEIHPEFEEHLENPATPRDRRRPVLPPARPQRQITSRKPFNIKSFNTKTYDNMETETANVSPQESPQNSLMQRLLGNFTDNFRLTFSSKKKTTPNDKSKDQDPDTPSGPTPSTSQVNDEFMIEKLQPTAPSVSSKGSTT